jgi:SNF2 family DNA or RNA helicase
MLILHGSWHLGSLQLWGETDNNVSSSSKPRSRTRQDAPVEPSPYAASADQLSLFVVEIGGGHRDASTATIWRPTVNGRPVPSSPLIDSTPNGTGTPALIAWQVPCISLSLQATFELLSACLDQPTLRPGVLVGSTLTYWSTALRYAGALTAREQYLPDLENGQACWRPVLSGREAGRFRSLARAMPAACRALSAGPECASAQAVLAAFLGSMVDVIVRGQSKTVQASSLSTSAGRRKTKAKGSFDSIHDQWLHALTTGACELTASKDELATLGEQLQTWKLPLTRTAAAPFRLCFRLEEPANGNGQQARPKAKAGDHWQVQYLLQDQEDLSLQIPAAQAWKPRGAAAPLLKRNAFQPREYLLATLGEAAGLSGEIEASLRKAEPSGYQTDVSGAHRFLTETAWSLEQAGFGVLLPAWWTRTGTKQRLTVTANVRKNPPMSGSGVTLDTLVQFDWQAALGDAPLTREELEALARLKAPLVKVRGQWVQVSAEEIEAALDFWKSKGEGEASLRDLMRMSLGVAPAAGVASGGVKASGWVGDFLAQLQGTARFEELPPPAGFRGTLRPYQQRGYSWLAFLQRWGLGACLADDMGLGKTIQTLALIQYRREQGEKRPVLLICPMSVVGNWHKEAARFTPDLAVLVHHGQKRERGDTFGKQAQRQHLVVSSYALLQRDQELLSSVRWAGVILDEAQNIKNPQTKQAQAARSLEADYRIALTGTPVENHVGDLWSIGQFLNPGLLGSQTEFRREFFIPIQVQRDAEAARRLQRRHGPFLLRRLKTDKAIIADLPAKLEMKVFCNLTKEQASLYAAVVDDLEEGLKGADGIQRKGIVLAALSKLKQVCNHPAQFLGDNSAIADRSGKLARLTEMLEEVVDGGDRALVFTQFTEMGEIISRHLREQLGQEVLFLHGGTQRKERDRLVTRFQAADGPRLFLLSLKAGGTGLTLTAANHVFHFDRWWNPAVEDQATDRAFRIGQKRNVQVHKFVCIGTLEERIDELIERKKEVAAQVVGTGEAWLTELSNKELRDLVALRPEAVGE